MNQHSQVEKIIQELQLAYPDSKPSLDFENPFQLLVATMLSAQTTDKAVNIVTPNLFKKYPSCVELSQATIDEIIPIIKSIGLYNNKAKNLLEMSKKVVEDFNGKIPQSIKDLTSLPGVGRKTATAVLANAFGISDQGITVDTHMMRVTYRLGWSTTEQKNANKIEKELMTVIPKKYWGIITHLIIDHGRAICSARKPKCSKCIIEEYCPSSLIGSKK